jgi:hypothetical protein
VGMYDDIEYEAPCPLCGTALTTWQSTDGSQALETLTTRELWDQTRFRGDILYYTNCDSCGTCRDPRHRPVFVVYPQGTCAHG